MLRPLYHGREATCDPAGRLRHEYGRFCPLIQLGPVGLAASRLEGRALRLSGIAPDRKMAYPKFRLAAFDVEELLAEYLPYCEPVDVTRSCPWNSRDPKDQPFLDLAECGSAEFLVSGDRDLLEGQPQTTFLIESPESYRRRVLGE